MQPPQQAAVSSSSLLPKRISSMFNKVHGQQQPPHVDKSAAQKSGPEAGGLCFPLGELANWKKLACRKKSLHCCLRKQLFCAHCLKLVSLFFIAITHVLYLHPFLGLFTQLDEYSLKLDGIVKDVPNPLRHTLYELAEYKKNLFLAVAALCVALSTSTFFLFLLTSAAMPARKFIYLIGTIDVIAFAALPFLFSMRATIVTGIRPAITSALEQAHKIVTAEKLMNEAQCSIQPRENLPLCSELIARSIFPVDLLKFLLIFGVMTLAYLLVAYLIYWCIKHWVPHSSADNQQRRKFCCCCAKSPKREPIAVYTPLGQSVVDGCYIGCAMPHPLVVPNPLMAVPSPPGQCSPA